MKYSSIMRGLFIPMLIVIAISYGSAVHANSIMIISADIGSGNGPWAQDFIPILENADYTVALWSLSTQGTPSLSDLEAHDAVIWTQGDRYQTLTEETMDLLQTFVQAGGRLVLDGSDIGFDSSGSASFSHGVLRARFEIDDAGTGEFEALDPDHPVMAGLPSSFTAGSMSEFPDGLSAVGGGHPLFRYTDTPFLAAISHPRTVYFAFPLHRFSPDLRETLLLNSIHFILMNVHDLAVTSIDPYHTHGVEVTVKNWGQSPESGRINYREGPDPESLVLQKSRLFELNPLESRTFIFDSAAAQGVTWWRQADIDPLPEELNTDNNTLLVSNRWIRPGHPRLFFTSSDLPALRARTTTTHAEQWQIFTDYLDTYLNYDYSDAPESYFFDDMTAFAFGYAISGNADYLGKAYELMSIMIRWEIPDDDMPNRQRLAELALALDWTYNGLTAVQRQPVIDRIGDYMAWVMNRFAGGTAWFQGHVRRGMITVCLGALSTIYDLPGAAEYLELSSDPILHHILPIWEYFGSNDGGNYYGTDYEGVVLYDMLTFFEGWESATGEDLTADSGFWPRCMDYRMAITFPDLSQDRIDDCWVAAALDYERVVANWTAGRFGVEEAQWFADLLAAGDSGNIALSPWDQWLDILWFDPDIASTAPDWTTRFFSGIGQVSMRTGWDENAVVIDFFCGDYGGGHDHYHQNSFTLFHRGNLAMHNGVYDNFGSPHHDGFYQRTIAHNTITVFDPAEDFNGGLNDGGQRFIREEFGAPSNIAYYEANQAVYETGDILRFHTDPELSYVMGDATAAYRPTKVGNFTRQLLFIQPEFLLVYDRLKIADPAWEVNWTLHSMNPPVIDGATATFTSGDGIMTCRTLLPEQAVLTSEPVFDVYGVTVPPEGDIELEPGDGRLDVSPAQKNDVIKFMHFINIGDTADPPSVTGVRIESRRGEAHGVSFDDWTVWFSNRESKAGAYLRDFRFTGIAPASRHLVFDVEPGATFRIYLNGAPTRIVTGNEAGFLRFNLAVSPGDNVRVLKERVAHWTHVGVPSATE